MRERIKWIDTAKFLGIFAIYLGHMGPAAGYSLGFVFIYHVPLFFFISGCMSTYDKENNFGKFVLKKIKTIMIPFWIFSILSIIVDTFLRNTGIEHAKHLLILVLKGNIRNTFVAAGLWFLSCLFVMEIMFKLLKYFKRKWLLLFLCFAMFIYSEMIATPSTPLSAYIYTSILLFLGMKLIIPFEKTLYNLLKMHFAINQNKYT